MEKPSTLFNGETASKGPGLPNAPNFLASLLSFLQGLVLDLVALANTSSDVSEKTADAYRQLLWFIGAQGNHGQIPYITLVWSPDEKLAAMSELDYQYARSTQYGDLDYSKYHEPNPAQVLDDELRRMWSAFSNILHGLRGKKPADEFRAQLEPHLESLVKNTQDELAVKMAEFVHLVVSGDHRICYNCGSSDIIPNEQLQPVGICGTCGAGFQKPHQQSDSKPTLCLDCGSYYCDFRDVMAFIRAVAALSPDMAHEVTQVFAESVWPFDAEEESKFPEQEDDQSVFDLIATEEGLTEIDTCLRAEPLIDFEAKWVKKPWGLRLGRFYFAHDDVNSAIERVGATKAFVLVIDDATGNGCFVDRRFAVEQTDKAVQ